MPSSSEGLDRRWRAIRKPVMTPYDTDVYAWSQEQAALLDGKQWDALDIANLIEEILNVGASQYTAVSSAVYQILVHLLKWRYQPACRLVAGGSPCSNTAAGFLDGSAARPHWHGRSR